MQALGRALRSPEHAGEKMSRMKVSTTPGRLWLVRHDGGVRILKVAVFAALAFITVMVITSGWESSSVAFRTPMTAFMVGILALWLNGVAHYGARLEEDALELEATIGRAVIPLSEVRHVHLAADRSLVYVETDDGYVSHHVRGDYTQALVDQGVARIESALDSRSIPFTLHDDHQEMWTLRPDKQPFFYDLAISGTFRRWNVWAPIAVATLLSILG